MLFVCVRYRHRIAAAVLFYKSEEIQSKIISNFVKKMSKYSHFYAGRKTFKHLEMRNFYKKRLKSISYKKIHKESDLPEIYMILPPPFLRKQKRWYHCI